MTVYLDKNIELLADVSGHGPAAEKGSTVVYNARLFLRGGDEVTTDFKSISMYGDRLDTREVDGVELIDHTTTLGRRQPIAGVEKSLAGMRPGGYREVLVGAHLAYGRKGLGDLIPPDAMLRIRLWVRDVQPAG